MRAFSISGRGVDRGPGGPDSLLDFLFGRGQRIVRDVQRALRYFRFDYAVQGFDRIGDFLLVDGISQFVDFNSEQPWFRSNLNRLSQLCFSCLMFVRVVVFLCIQMQMR